MDGVTKYNSQFKDILADNKSGSVRILSNLITWIKTVVRAETGFSREALLANLNTLSERRPELVVIENFGRDFSSILSGSDGAEVMSWLEDYEAYWRNASNNISDKLKQELTGNSTTLLLHSHSETVVQVLSKLVNDGCRLEIIQTESRPMMEGRRQVLHFDQLGLPCQLIIDSDIPRYMERIDLVVFGADQFSDSVVINKTGSYAIALMASHFNVPVYVLADRRKEVKHPGEVTASPSQEIWLEKPAKVVVENYYFEEIPRSLVNLITE